MSKVWSVAIIFSCDMYANFMTCWSRREKSEFKNFMNACYGNTDKRTDVWSRDFMIWKVNFGLWAVAWAGVWDKRVWADYEQLLRPVFSLFRCQNFFLKGF